MRQLRIAIDDGLASLLDRVVPARSRQRSEFLRAAIRHAVRAAQERQVREAYERLPIELDALPFDPEEWGFGFGEPGAASRRSVRRNR